MKNTKFNTLKNLAITGFVRACSLSVSQASTIAIVAVEDGLNMTVISAKGSIDLTGLSQDTDGLTAFPSIFARQTGQVGVATNNDIYNQHRYLGGGDIQFSGVDIW